MVAQAQRVLQAFAIVNGRNVPLNVRVVSLAEARAEMPFEVIPPAGISPELQLTIRALSSNSSPADSRLMFEYRGNRPGPPFTIMEMSEGNPSTKFMLSESVEDKFPSVRTTFRRPTRNYMYGHFNHVGKLDTYRVLETAWVQRGTRVLLIAPAGSLSADRVEAIRAAMAR